MKCPKCNRINSFCEEIDLKIGEVIGYHCNICGYINKELEKNDLIDNMEKNCYIFNEKI